MELDQVPEHLIVLGGGYIGLEFGQMFRRFGSRVTIIQRGRQLLPREDADVAGAVLGILREDGIEVLLQAEAAAPSGATTAASASSPGPPTASARSQGSHLLLAAGRVPNTDRLDPQAAGVETDAKGFIRVNERLETNVPGVYALGDVKGGPAFTHISYDDFRILRANLLERRRQDHRRPPGAVHGVHRPAARPRRPHRAGGHEAGAAVPRRQDADELRGAGAGDGRDAGHDEGRWSTRRAGRSWAPRSSASRAARSWRCCSSP